jgi:nitrogen-specific signal transduction histidine kinase
MLLKADQTEFMAMLAASPLNWRGEKSVVISIHDISHLKRIERTLKQTERVAFLGRILDDINHQIRNPIIVVGGLARRISKEKNPKPAWIQAIAKEAMRLEDLLDTIHDFSNLPGPSFKQVTIRTMVDRLELLLRQSTSQSAQIICEDEYFKQKVSVDLDLFCQAIGLIIQNAVEAAVDGTPEIQISINGQKEDTIDKLSFPFSVNISDRGVGINHADLSKVFEPFFTRKTFHHGMGLTIAKRIISEQDGEITITSEPGKGTLVRAFMVSERRRPIRIEKL